MTALVSAEQELLTLLERIARRIRHTHPEVPKNDVRLAHKRCGQADHTYVTPADIEGGAELVLIRLLHEAAHGLARVRDISDTSGDQGYGRRGSKYHNGKFRDLAGEVGLDAKVVQSHKGYSSLLLTERARTLYGDHLHTLVPQLETYRQALLNTPSERPSDSRNGYTLVCDCTEANPLRKTQARQGSIDFGEIICGVCGTAFRKRDA